MHHPTTPISRSGYVQWLIALLFVGVLSALLLVVYHAGAGEPGAQDSEKKPAKPSKPEAKKPAPDDDDNEKPRIPAPELEGGIEWLNTAGPIRMKDLRGKIVLLDFWTFCCINCIHVMPDLAKLEKKYPNELVVIGVHSAKFENEKESQNIREAILRYHIEHPVVNDAEHKIWNAYGVRSWPTFYLIDPEGNIFGRGSGEGLFEPLDEAIAGLIQLHKKKKTLNDQPIRFDLDKFKLRKDSPLFFPGKVIADAASKRIFIADSSHHRIVITDMEGKKLEVVGTGEDGLVDGPFEKAKFNDPHGLALHGETLYVADRKNHSIRAIDLKTRTVKLAAGKGEQATDFLARRGPAAKPLDMPLNSPWDLLIHNDIMYIAMAGHHQIWQWDLKKAEISPFAGNGRENIADGKRASSEFAQPSGLATDGKWLYVADSEVSAIRAVSLDPKLDEVKTIVGEGLFEFGDIDDVGDKARLQHALGVGVYQGQVYVADTYNNKIKQLHPEERSSKTYLGDGKPGNEDKPARFNEPAGLCVAGDLFYVADTNNHSIRIIDPKSKEVRTLKLQGVTPPAEPTPSTKPSFPNAITAKLAETTIPPDGEVTLQISLNLPDGYKLSAAPVQYLIEAPEVKFEQTGKVEKPKKDFAIKLPATKLIKAKSLKVSLVFYPCQEGGEGLCLIRSQIWEMPVKLSAEAKERNISLTTSAIK